MLRASLAKASPPVLRRCMTSLASAKKEGDISDAFTSLSGAQREPLPDRYRQLKLALLQGREDKIVQSWKKLLSELKRENEIVAQKGPGVIPQIEFKDLERSSDALREEVKKRGVVVVRGVVPEGEARAYKAEVEEYVARNPSTRAFPPHDPQVYELYWSPPQLKARSHPNFLSVQQNLMSLWHTTSQTAISISQPFSYADRLRIRQPGDASFALGPHIDGGSVERWEPEGYGAGHVYDAILQGNWEAYDPWNASGRVDAVNNRPFFKARSERVGEGYLEEGNWELMGDVDSELQGATPGTGQELTGELHPHLELERTMVHVPEIRPGDFVAWHCDTIHSVDKVHAGKADSSVLYIPICPITAQNAEYMVRQREAFLRGTPGPDFPGGAGEAGHVGRGTEEMLDGAARRAMGLSALMTEGEEDVVREANRILGF
ncbi:DUF1479 domain protein [Fusarium tjaetaba]|uniref:DUF1479 domain protein n=1 Tax=Fusarium tjaetaba TaxID=1567544 RepID=A0A8H5R7N7_9HYPO|nr:DUF1479 domain protein [Fusarium tjaetaba]KAF5627893.1 DUF1479 domain protein [Fusarium tjaetaba]